MEWEKMILQEILLIGGMNKDVFMSYDTITKLFITKITILYIHLMDMD
jgi:hypothetical protein